MERAAAGRSDGGIARTDPGLMAVQKLLAALSHQERGALEGAIEQAILRLAGAPSRDRADALLALLENPEIGTPSGHPVVRDAAVRALVEMGFPYALEVPPEALSEAMGRRRSPGAGLRRGLAFGVFLPFWLFSVVGSLVQLALAWLAGPRGLLWAGPIVLLNVALGTAGLGLLRRTKVRRNRWFLFAFSLGAVGYGFLGSGMMTVTGIAGLVALAISPSHEGNVRGLD